jgi:hypothetical protein
MLIPTTGWRGSKVDVAAEWAWRAAPLRDVRPESERPRLTQTDTLFPDAPARKAEDIVKPDLEGYHRAAERHARQLSKLQNTRQVLFASSLGLVRFEKRPEKSADGKADVGDVVYAIQELYTAVPDPAELTTPPKPLVYARHEAPLRDAWGEARPDIQPPKTL